MAVFIYKRYVFIKASIDDHSFSKYEENSAEYPSLVRERIGSIFLFLPKNSTRYFPSSAVRSASFMPLNCVPKEAFSCPGTTRIFMGPPPFSVSIYLSLRCFSLALGIKNIPAEALSTKLKKTKENKTNKKGAQNFIMIFLIIIELREVCKDNCV